MTTATPTTTDTRPAEITTPGTCTVEEFVEAFMVTGLVPVPGDYYTTLPDGTQGACALGARCKQFGLDVEGSQELDDEFHDGVVNGFDCQDPLVEHPVYQQGYAVGQRVRALMGVTDV